MDLTTINLLHSLKEKIIAALGNVSNSPGVKIEELMKLLRRYKITYKLQNLHCINFFVHKANRSGLGLSPFNVHQNAAKIFF